MTIRNLIGGAASAALLTLFASAGAHAQNFSFASDFIGTGGGTSQNVTSNSGLSSVIGTDGSATGIGTPTAIVLTNLTTFSTAPSPDAFTARAYSIALTLTNARNGQALTQTLGGDFTGSVSTTSAFFTQANFNQSVLNYNFSNGDVIQVSNFQFQSPGAPGSTTRGSIGAVVQFTTLGAAAPEPGSIALAGMGLVSMGGLAVRRKRPTA